MTLAEQWRREGYTKGIEVGFAKGFQEGLERGKQEGLARGKQEGLARGKQIGFQGILQAANLLKQGLSYREVAEATELSIQEVQAIKASLGA